MQTFFDFYRANEGVFYSTQLVLAMLGMGATSTLQQFRDVLRAPGNIALLLGLQFVLMPLLAVGFGKATGVPNEIAIGLVLLVALPSGSLSNIMTFLGRGNVPLSITATCDSTTVCLVVTPLVLRLFAARQLPTDFEVPLDKTVVQITLLLLLPLAVGMAIGDRWPRSRRPLSRLAVGGSMIALACVVVGAIGGGRIDVLHYGWKTPAWLAAFVVATLLLTYWFCLALRYAKSDAFTLGIEVAMRNGNLGVALCIPLFGTLTESNLLHQGALYVCLFGGGAMLVIGMIAVVRRQFRFARKNRAGINEV